MQTTAEVLGYNKKRAWFRFAPGVLTKGPVILTMPRSVLKRGFATASVVEVEVDEKSLSFDGTHFRADMELLNVVSIGTRLHPETSGEEGD